MLPAGTSVAHEQWGSQVAFPPVQLREKGALSAAGAVPHAGVILNRPSIYTLGQLSLTHPLKGVFTARVEGCKSAGGPGAAHGSARGRYQPLWQRGERAGSFH